jgi:hypothetical protein
VTPENEKSPVMGVPSDNTTMTEVLRQLGLAGYDAQLIVTDDSSVLCARCGVSSEARDVTVHSRRRMEGASDPADMVVVLAAACPACGARGTLVMGYGPNASGPEGDVQRALRAPLTE